MVLDFELLKEINIIVLKPNVTQNSETTRKGFKDMINPSSSIIPIKNIKVFQDVSVACNHPHESETIKQKDEEVLGDKYEVLKSKFLKPFIKIVGIEDTITDELLRCIHNQNEYIKMSISNESDTKVKVIENMKQRYPAITKCDNQTHANILEKGNFSI
ncbi:hypothetical protein WA026_015158 [Henosepilachna vigintioctopunctata]|uniref:Uncharacterized protein n=1 Tax=Henosepilachna vigintioctopunctata TaxID=420089 RepID=A0AAW1TMD4_9CUCU